MHAKAEGPPWWAPIGVQFKVGSQPCPQISDKVGRVMIMTNILAYYNTAIILAVKKFYSKGL